MNAPMNSEQLTEIDALRARVVELEQTLAGNVRLIEKYEDIIRRLAQRHWGRSSEKNPGQAELSLFEEAELVAMGDTPEDEHAHGDDAVSDGFDPSGPPETESGTVDAGAPASTVPPTRRRKRVLPDHLERVIVRHELDELQRQCPCGCAGQLMPIGEEVTEQLGVMPATHFVIQHVRVKYACPCKGAGVQTAPMPTALIPGSQASPALVAATMVGKYDWGSPLYRQERIARSFGLELPRSKLARWIIASVDHLRPLYNLMQDALLDYDIVLSDDTGIQVLKEDGRAPSTKSALWIRRGGAPGTPVVLVDYRQTKGLREARSLLEYCTGYLVCDGAPTFERAAELQGLTLVLCNDHARRKFVEAERDGKKAKTLGWIASKALGFYKKLYEIERKAKHLTPAQRLENRVRKAVPIWELFIAWATRIHSEGVRDLATRKALEYLIRHETGLRRYCEDGRLPISNILSEHVAKTVSISRKYVHRSVMRSPVAGTTWPPLQDAIATPSGLISHFA